MENHTGIFQVGSGKVRCTGPALAPHPPVEIALEPGRIPRCPICNRRLQHARPPDRVGPAAWPRKE